MPKFRKKPIVIEAFQMGIDARPDWFQDKVSSNEIVTYIMFQSDFAYSYCDIKTLEGTMRGGHGDYIIQGVSGEVYPCKPDIFHETYELVEEQYG